MCVHLSFDFSDIKRGHPVVYRSVLTIPTYILIGTCVIGIYDILLSRKALTHAHAHIYIYYMEL